MKNTTFFYRNFLLLSLLCGNIINAFDFREPIALEKGPLRLISEEIDSGFGLRYWSAAYMRDAQKAFTGSHGTNAQDIAALFFSGGDTKKGTIPFENGFTFRPTQMFPDWYVTNKGSKYNPLLRTANLRLSVRYNESGIMMGANWDMPVIQNCARIGFRASIPAKKIKVTKVDMEGVKMGAEKQDVLSIQSVNNISGPSSAIAQGRLILVRLDFAEALNQSGDLNTALQLGADGVVKIGSPNVHFGQSSDIAKNGYAFPSVSGGLLTEVSGNITPNTGMQVTRNVAIVYSPEGIVPRFDDKNLAYINAALISSASKQTAAEIRALGIGEFAVFGLGNDYSSLAEKKENSLSLRRLMQEDKSNLWLVSIFSPNNGQSEGTSGSGVFETLNVLSNMVTENVYEWFHDKKVDFETYTKEGLGDLVMDFFYNYTFNKNLAGEAFVGFVAPTGGKIKWDNNPYKVNLGSGHWHIKAGGMVNWTPNNMFGIKIDGHYGYAFSELEERHATFQNAIVKLGPPVDANVKWDYFVINADLNLSHFSAKDITGLIGYQLYYKRSDSVRFKKTKAKTWLEQEYNAATKTYSPLEGVLDAKLAEANTNSIAHRVRCEASFIMTDWLEFFAGGAWTFAGRNTLRSTDAHFGFNIAF